MPACQVPHLLIFDSFWKLLTDTCPKAEKGRLSSVSRVCPVPHSLSAWHSHQTLSHWGNGVSPKHFGESISIKEDSFQIRPKGNGAWSKPRWRRTRKRSRGTDGSQRILFILYSLEMQYHDPDQPCHLTPPLSAFYLFQQYLSFVFSLLILNGPNIISWDEERLKGRERLYTYEMRAHPAILAQYTHLDGTRGRWKWCIGYSERCHGAGDIVWGMWNISRWHVGRHLWSWNVDCGGRHCDD